MKLLSPNLLNDCNSHNQNIFNHQNRVFRNLSPVLKNVKLGSSIEKMSKVQWYIWLGMIYMQQLRSEFWGKGAQSRKLLGLSFRVRDVWLKTNTFHALRRYVGLIGQPVLPWDIGNVRHKAIGNLLGNRGLLKGNQILWWIFTLENPHVIGHLTYGSREVCFIFWCSASEFSWLLRSSNMIRLKIDQLKYSRFLARYISWTCYSYLTVTGVPNSFEGILIQSKSKHAFEKVRHRVCFVHRFFFTK